MEAGQDLGTITMDLTLQRLVMMSAANMDFAPTHIDDVAARASGAPAAYADMISVFALLEKFTRSVFGPTAQVKRLGPVRLRDFIAHGQTVVIGGDVQSVDSTQDGTTVVADLWIRQDATTAKATGRVTVEMRNEDA